MNAITELIDELNSRGHRLDVSGGKLRIVPAVQDAELIERLREAKPTFLDIAAVPGWPSDVPIDGRLIDALSGLTVLQARSQKCHDIDCGYPVAVEWSDTSGDVRWSCPRCGLESVDPDILPGRGRYSDLCDELDHLFQNGDDPR